MNDSWLAITSRNANTSSRGWGRSMETVTGEVMMYHMVQFRPCRSQMPGSGCSMRSSTTSPTRGISDLSLRELRGGDRHQPPDADPPLRRRRGPPRRGGPRGRGAPASGARRRPPRPRHAGRRRHARCGGATSPTSRCGRTSGCSSSSTARRCRAARAPRSCSTGSSTRGSSRRRRSSPRTASPSRTRSPGSASPSPAGCCSTCSPPATARRSTPRWRSTSPH